MRVTWDVVHFIEKPDTIRGTDHRTYVVNASVIKLWKEEPSAILEAEPYSNDRWIISTRYAD